MNNVDYKRAILTDGFLFTHPKSFDPWIYQIPVEMTVHTYANVSHPKYINFIWKYLSLVPSELVKQEFLFCLNLLQWDGNSSKECYTIKPDVLKGGFLGHNEIWDGINLCERTFTRVSSVGNSNPKRSWGVFSTSKRWF